MAWERHWKRLFAATSPKLKGSFQKSGFFTHSLVEGKNFFFWGGGGGKPIELRKFLPFSKFFGKRTGTNSEKVETAITIICRGGVAHSFAANLMMACPPEPVSSSSLIPQPDQCLLTNPIFCFAQNKRLRIWWFVRYVWFVWMYVVIVHAVLAEPYLLYTYVF